MPTKSAGKESDCCTYCRPIFFEGRCAWCMFDAVRGTTNDINALGVVLEELKKYSRYFEIELDGGQTLSPRRIKHRWDDDLVLRQRHREDYLVSLGRCLRSPAHGVLASPIISRTKLSTRRKSTTDPRANSIAAALPPMYRQVVHAHLRQLHPESASSNKVLVSLVSFSGQTERAKTRRTDGSKQRKQNCLFVCVISFSRRGRK